MGARPKISFCVPTYNRGWLVERNVKTLLGFAGMDIEVVVVDDASPDDTAIRMRSISDPRLRFYHNERNLNFVENFKLVTSKAQGEWVFTLSDEDKVTPQIASKLIELTSDKALSEVSVMLGNIRNAEGPYPYYAFHDGKGYIPYRYENKRFGRGDEAVVGVGFHHKYVSGILVRTDSIDWQSLDAYSRSECGIAPQVDMYTRACTNGTAATFDLDFCIKRVDRGERSFVDKVSSSSYKSPQNRMIQFKYYISLADQLVADPLCKVDAFVAIYGYYIDEGTYGWNRLISSESERRYYFEKFDSEVPDLDEAVRAFHAEAIAFIESRSENWNSALGGLDRVRQPILERLRFFAKKRGVSILWSA